jgi:hypothetical protein
MTFENMLLNADPEDAAEAANVIARAFVNDPSVSEEARAAAAKILELSVQELTRKLQEAREKEAAPANDAPGAARSSQTEAEPSSA